jgi:hypothetical protein
MDIVGDEFVYILEIAMPTQRDLTNLGIYVGQIMAARLGKPQNLKGNGTK